jgi:serine/threonine protein phosphatase PrpC
MSYKYTERQHSTEMPQHITKRKHTHRTSLNSHGGGQTPFIFSLYTIPCERHPERNEDSILVDMQSGLAAVFDGVGGSAAGEIASRTAMRAAKRYWHERLAHLQSGRKRYTILEYDEKIDVCLLLEQLIQEADELVRTEGAQKAGTDDLATTVALATFSRRPETRDYIMHYAHVGDSRIYLLREGEPLKRLTNDDGLLAKLVENQMLTEEDAHHIDQAMYTEQLTETEFSYFRLRGGITQALGGPLPPLIHVDQTTIVPGDRILLCTDGIHDNLTDEEIEDILRNVPRTTTARSLVEASLTRSHQDRSMTIRAKPDDMSAIVLTCRF